MNSENEDGPNYGPGCLMMIVGIVGFLVVLIAGMGGQ